MKNPSPHKRGLQYRSDSGYSWEEDDDVLKNISFGQPQDITLPKGLLLASKMFGRPLSWYIRNAWLVIILFSLGEIAIIYSQFYLPLSWPDYYFWLVLGLWRIIMMIVPAEYVLTKHKGTLIQAQIITALSSFLAGIVVALWQFFCYVDIWKNWQILAKPFIFALFAWIIVYWWQKISLTNIKK